MESVFVDLAAEPTMAAAALLFREQRGDAGVVGADEFAKELLGSRRNRLGSERAGAERGEGREGGGGGEEVAAMHGGKNQRSMSRERRNSRPAWRP